MVQTNYHTARRYANKENPLYTVPKKAFATFTSKELGRQYGVCKTMVNYIRRKRGIKGTVGRCYLCGEIFTRTNNSQRGCPECVDEGAFYAKIMAQCDAYEKKVRKQLLKRMTVWNSDNHTQEELRGLVPSLRA
jgi:hypothetical protein